MTTEGKFLATGVVILSLPFVFRASPGAAILMGIGLLALAYFVVRGRGEQ